MPLVLLILIKNLFKINNLYLVYPASNCLINGICHPHLVSISKICALRKHNNYANGLTIIRLVYK